MPGLMRRAMVYLGLTEDEYDEYERYDDLPAQVPPPAPVRAYSYASEPAPPTNSIRTLPMQEGVGPLVPRPAAVRPMPPPDKPRVHVVAPGRFADAQQIGDRLRTNQPVIVNLQVVDRDLSRRMIDFCSGVTYALSGSMEKVADQVFLLTPSNVEVSAEERQKLSERGFYRS